MNEPNMFELFNIFTLLDHLHEVFVGRSVQIFPVCLCDHVLFVGQPAMQFAVEVMRIAHEVDCRLQHCNTQQIKLTTLTDLIDRFSGINFVKGPIPNSIPDVVALLLAGRDREGICPLPGSTLDPVLTFNQHGKDVVCACTYCVISDRYSLLLPRSGLPHLSLVRDWTIVTVYCMASRNATWIDFSGYRINLRVLYCMQAPWTANATDLRRQLH